MTLPEGQSVHVVYALGYGNKDIQTALGLNLQQAGLPLMQVWQEHLALDGVTLFTNPLSPNTPLDALTDGSHTANVWPWTFLPPTLSAPSVCKARASRCCRSESGRQAPVQLQRDRQRV
nr:hypothetical protein [Neisseria subflava]